MSETPNSETRKRIVDDAINIIKAKKPDMITPPETTDLDRLMEQVGAIALKIDSLIKPIADNARDSGMSQTKQHAMLFATLHKFWIDELMKFNHDEVLFLCALVHAHTMKERYI